MRGIGRRDDHGWERRAVSPFALVVGQSRRGDWIEFVADSGAFPNVPRTDARERGRDCHPWKSLDRSYILAALCDGHPGQSRSELDAANAGIVALARNKLYALAEIAEGTRGRQKLDAMLGDELQNAIQMQVAAMTNLKSACNGILGRGVEELKTSERYPQERARVLNYKIGYAWGPPGCEYQVVFPVPPEVHTIEANQQPILQATTRGGNMPAITAACRTLPPGGALAAISQIKTGGMRTLEDSGVKNLRLQEQNTQKGYELNATGEKSVEGTDMIVTTVFYLGKTSSLEVAITESASVTPSLIATQFLDWIDRPNLKR
jgi:hypothetical protein